MSRWLLVSAAWLVVCASTTGAERAVVRVDETRVHIGRGSIAAGRAHSVLAAPDGRVYTWGAGGRGQLGDGTLNDRWTPTMVAGLEGIVAVSAGAAHTVALSQTGEVFSWGANADGRLGDGTERRRLSPVRVLGLTNVRMIAAGQAHTLALTGDGWVFAWGLNEHGQVGIGKKVSALRPVRITGLDDVVTIAAGEAHSLAVTSDGRLHAWGRNDSSQLGDGTTRNRLRPVRIGLTDVLGVAAGGAHSLALLRSGAVYSWGSGAHGELGTGEKTVSSRPRIVPGLTARSIHAGRHFSAAVTDEGWLLMWGANASGQLGNGTTTRHFRPVVVPDLEPVTDVALGATHVIAVTIGGDVRTWGEGRLGRLGNGTVRDRRKPLEVMAGVPDWGEDPTEPEPPQGDMVPPTISVSTSPPLQSGWMTTAVTVTFECGDDVGVAVCPAPVTINEDAAARTVSGTAIDSAGNQATASVTLNVDVDAPRFLIDHPQTGESFDADSLLVSGRLDDLGSGVAYARCNGRLLALVGGAIECEVTLRAGRNDIVLQAVDTVGHSTTQSITVFRKATGQALKFAHAVRRMTTGETAILTVHDEAGAVVDGASWSVADEAVVSLAVDNPSVISAIGVGETVITAQKDGLRADLTIIVTAALAAGDIRWSLPSIDGMFSEPPLFANRVDAEGPSLFAIDTASWGEATLRALSRDGELLWQQHVPGVPLMGDTFGGVIVGVPYDVNSSGDYGAYLRVGGGSVRPWRYESAGLLVRPAQASDGTIYANEALLGGLDQDGDEIWDRYITVIDGVTGSPISRTLLPRDIEVFVSENDGFVVSPLVQCRSYRHEIPPQVVGPVVGTDGRGYWLVRRYEIHKRASCNEPSPRRADRTISMALDLLAVSPNGEQETVEVFSASCQGGVGTTVPCDILVRMFGIMPDGIGGTLVTWEYGSAMTDANRISLQRVMTRIDGEGEVTGHPVSQLFSLEMIGQDGIVYVHDGGWRTMDTRTGAIKWSFSSPATSPLAAGPDGGVAALDWLTGELAIMNANGGIESRQPFGLHWSATQAGGEWIGLKDGQLSAVVGDFADATRFAPAKGNEQGQLSVRKPGMGISIKSHSALWDVPVFHNAIKIAATNQVWMEAWYAERPQLVPVRDLFKNLYITLGAGLPNGDDTTMNCVVPGGDRLVSDTNRDGDINKPASRWTDVPVPQHDEPAAIQRLLDLHERYNDSLPYACFPEGLTGFYNSNSYARSLLIHAGLPHEPWDPISPSPGWNAIIPLEFFPIK